MATTRFQIRECIAYLSQLDKCEGIQLEPSALAGMLGPIIVANASEYQKRLGLDDRSMENATHLVWATGGGMVPEKEMASYLAKAVG